MVIAVGATVRPYARIAVKSEPVGLRLTADDIERGYIDVPAPTILEVRTNSPRGYILRFDRVGDRLFLVVEDRELGVMLGSEGGRIVADHRGQAAHHVQLQWRFFLLEDVEPGVYPWPLLTSVAPRE